MPPDDGRTQTREAPVLGWRGRLEALQRSAERYGITVEEYKTRNLMKTEIKSADVGAMVSAMAGKLFGKTTGAQVPMDGGNDRVI